MSRPCRVPSCQGPVPDDKDWLGCSFHQPRIRLFTWERLMDARTPVGYLDAEQQAIREMTGAP